MYSQDDLNKLPRWPQRQDSLTDQLRDLVLVADRLGLHDAADLVRNTHLQETRR